MSNIYNSTPHELLIANVVKSEGVSIFDDTDKKYMDLESGVWCTSLGHNNKQLNDVIKKQIDTIMHAGFCYSSNIVEQAAEEVLSITGFTDGKCVFLCSGSEAIELGRQISKHITKKKLSMTLHDSYLGSYSSVINRDDSWFLFNWEKCNQCPDHGQCKKECEKLKEIPTDVSEFIFEPGSSSGFVRFPPPSLIRNIVDIVKANGGKIIANEVTTGVGRTGKWFGYNHYQITPDIVAIGKGIGNGYPVSIAVINSETSGQLENSDFKYMQSHQNDPLGAAIVLHVIQTIIKDNLIAKTEKSGEKLLCDLRSLADENTILDVRGRGLMLALDVCDKTVSHTIYKQLVNKGYLLCHRGNLLRIDPPLIIQEEHLNDFVQDLKIVLEEIKETA